MLKIAVKINGESRKLLTGANYIQCLAEYLNESVRLFLYATDDAALNQAVLGGISGLACCGLSSEWGKVKKQEYDIVLNLDVYPVLEHVKKQCLKKNSRLRQLAAEWKSFQADEKFC